MRNPLGAAAVLIAISGCSRSKAPATRAAEPVPTAAENGAHVGEPPGAVAAWSEGAMLFDGLGTHHREVTTQSQEAQTYFDQGLRLLYGFNHDESTRSFARAAEIDPTCAMCYWGVAVTLGPNYNVPMLADRAPVAWEALQQAQRHASRGSEVEQALIAALGTRYRGPEPLTPAAMQPYNIAYAQAMRRVAEQFPDDLDVATLTAEAMMDVNPWQLWTRDGTPAEGTKEIVALLESVLARDPSHPGANHYYIHAIEASPRPERALPSAQRLPGLMPGAGHVVHMPAHIFQRVGRYEEASAHNARAAEVDLAYMKKVKPPGYYPMYLAHNYGFLAYSESMRGRKEPSLRASRESAKHMPPEMLAMMPGMDFFASLPLLVMVRFGTWDELLDEPRPQAKYQVMTALWLHAHGFALAATGRLEEARAELGELRKLQRELPADLRAGNNAAADLAHVAAQVLEARIAQAEQRPEALGLWAEAVALGDQLGYSEPADWFYPIRHYYGAALLEAGNYQEAESVYREDLRQHPRNGWALFGLWKALEGQGKAEDAGAAKVAFEEAWEDADVELTSTAF